MSGLPDFGTWVATVLTLIVFSFIFRDNPLYRFAEHVYVGVSAGYYIAIQWKSVLVPNLFLPLRSGEHWMLLLPAALCIMLFLRFAPRFGWTARWPIALYVGVYAGINLLQYVQGDVLPQAQATMLRPDSITNVVILLGTLATLSYFFFSLEHRGLLGRSARAGMWFLMVSFGAVFGTTVMSRMSLLIGRIYFLLREWLYPLLGVRG